MKFEIRGDSEVINRYHYLSCGTVRPKRSSSRLPDLSTLARKLQRSAELDVASSCVILIMTLVHVIRLIIDWYMG
jgi:hypothetical protein